MDLNEDLVREILKDMGVASEKAVLLAAFWRERYLRDQPLADVALALGVPRGKAAELEAELLRSLRAARSPGKEVLQ